MREPAVEVAEWTFEGGRLCTDMAVISIMRTMQVPFTSDLETESTEVYPQVFREFHLIYRTIGEGIDRT